MIPVLVDRERSVPNPDCLVVHSLDELVGIVRGAEESEAAA